MSVRCVEFSSPLSSNELYPVIEAVVNNVTDTISTSPGNQLSCKVI